MMINRIVQSDKDREYLAAYKYENAPIDIDLARVVVNKPWGSEYLFFKNDLVEMWVLFIKSGHATSMHCHPNKKSGIVVIDGKAIFSTVDKAIELNPMDTAIIDAGTFHSTGALSEEGVWLLELETPPMKHDLVRLNDKYGRARQGYEGLKNMLDDDGSCIRFLNNLDNRSETLGKVRFSVISVKTHDDLNPIFNHSDVAIIVKGKILSKEGNTLYSTSDVLNFTDLNSNYQFEDVSILLINNNA